MKILPANMIISNHLPANYLVITEVILSIASNYQPTYYLTQAIDELTHWGQLQLSHAIIDNQYHNYMAHLALSPQLDYATLFQYTKELENKFDRKKFTKPIVSLDIDIIAIKFNCTPSEIIIDEKNKPMVALNSHWFAIARRLPLAHYEIAGIHDLLNYRHLSDLVIFLGGIESAINHV